MDNRKTILDNILERHQTDIVGDGYIDIIVSRSNYTSLIKELILEDFKITSISWWEFCIRNDGNKYGLGGPLSKHYNGWYSELPIEIDDFKFENLDVEKNIIIQHILTTIEQKEIKYPDEKIKFTTSLWLTPAIWLEVPDEWKSIRNN